MNLDPRIVQGFTPSTPKGPDQDTGMNMDIKTICFLAGNNYVECEEHLKSLW